MKTVRDKLEYKIPAGHAEAGEKKPRDYEYEACENEREALDTIKTKADDAKGGGTGGWSLVELVNEKIKSAARSNAYQSAMAFYRESKLTEEQAVEKLVRDMVRNFKISEDIARKQIAGLRAG